MAEAAAGLAVGAISLAGMFTTCVQCFEMIESGTNYAEDLEIIYTGFEAQRVRLIIWGQTVGFERSPDHLWEQPVVQEAIRRGLNCIELLFEDGEKLMSKYGLQISVDAASGQSLIFKETYRRFKQRMLASQAQAPLMQTTKWAIRNKSKFKDLVADLRNLVDDLESITRTAETLRRQRAIVEYEIASVSDESSLQLIEEASSLQLIEEAASASAGSLSGAASIRLSQIREGHGSTDIDHGSTRTTFWSAHTRTSAPDESEGTQAAFETDFQQQAHDIVLTQNERLGQLLGVRSTHICTDAQPHPAVTTSVHLSCEPVWFNLDDNPGIIEELTTVAGLRIDGSDLRRGLHRTVVELSKPNQERGWRCGLSRIDTATKTLICFFEGAHDSPYVGGIFYLRMFIPTDFPFKPPVCQLLTKIYHPNFDAQGRICTDILYTQWAPVIYLSGTLTSIASLLGDPNTNDPLVPEIAAQYIQDRAMYNKTAREYTQKFATSVIPDVPLEYGNKPWWEYVKISA